MQKDVAEEIGQIALDIIESDREIMIIAPVAGIDLEDIDVTLNNGILTLSGIRKRPDEVYDDGVIRSSECFWGKFTRNVILPESLDFDSVKATMENGLLLITIAKFNFSSKHIEVENKDS